MLRGARGQNQVLLGKATFLPTFTCNNAGLLSGNSLWLSIFRIKTAKG